jgi:AraC family transcriptional regulator, regulatory protein of adaptative response / methylated-DNA-[protein]-cysteine methyltransferase
MREDEYWQAILNRDRTYDGIFFCAVRSTKIYCLPSCPSRQPRRENVLFFSQSSEAEAAGFRPCKRCRPDLILPDEPHLDLIENICRAIAQQSDRPPTLTQLATQFNISPYHLQRTFKRLVGVTPKQYANAYRLDLFKLQLKNQEKVTDAAYEVGYGSISSLYEQTSMQLGMTPTSYQNGGGAMQIAYTIVPCSLGYLLVATTEKGICSVKLGDRADELKSLLFKEFDSASFVCDDLAYQDWVQQILNFLSGSEPHLDLPLDIRGTAFQKQVWQALKKIPYGETRTYQEIASAIGRPKAVRAVGNACGSNPVALIVPCHRVLRGNGSLGGYAWGCDRKRKLLERESKSP